MVLNPQKSWFLDRNQTDRHKNWLAHRGEQCLHFSAFGSKSYSQREVIFLQITHFVIENDGKITLKWGYLLRFASKWSIECLQMTECWLSSSSQTSSRDVCIIYMLPVRVLEQKHRVRRRLTFKNNYSKAPPDEPPSYTLLQNSICGSMFSKKVEQSAKKIWGSLCDLCISILHALMSVHTHILQQFVMAFLPIREIDL